MKEIKKREQKLSEKDFHEFLYGVDDAIQEATKELPSTSCYQLVFHHLFTDDDWNPAEDHWVLGVFHDLATAEAVAKSIGLPLKEEGFISWDIPGEPCANGTVYGNIIPIKIMG